MGFVTKYGNPYQTGGLQHLTARLIREIVGEETFRSYYRFAVIRNPFDKAVSQYAFMQRRSDLRAYLGMNAGDEFKRYLELIGKRAHVQWQAQHTFVYDRDGTLLVDDLVRYETLDQGMTRIFSRLGIDASLPKRNVSEREPLTSYYDAEAQGMVEALYREDLDRFNYVWPA